MSLFFEDFEQWYEVYETASYQAQYESMLDLISKPIPLDYALEVDLVSILIDMQGLLEGHNLIEPGLSFTATLQTQQPELYQKEFYYFDDFPMRHALFNREPDKIDAALVRYKKDPVSSIEQLLPMLDDLRLYDARSQAVDVSCAVYVPVATSSKLLSGSEDTFGAVVIADMLEQAYKTLQQSNSVDWEAWGEKAAPFSFENTAESRQEVAQILARQMTSGPALVDLWQKDSSSVCRQLSLRFNAKMADQNQLSFVCSQAIWSAVMTFLDARNLSKKLLSDPDHFFSFNFDELDRYVSRLMGGIFSSRQSMGFAFIWGLPHVYGFLRAEAVIGNAVYESAITMVTEFQSSLLENWFAPLWRFSFVHRWGKPEHQTDSEFADEAQRFASTIDDLKPLSTEPTEKLEWGKMLSNMAKTMAKKTPVPKPSPSVSPSANLKSMKMSKPRKSALQEAKALNKKAKSGNKKKKKGKGFN